MRRLISTTLALALAATLASISWGAAAESRCDSDLVIFSRSSSNLVGSVNPNGAVCIPGLVVPAAKAIADQQVDFRLIWPNSDIIQILYTEDDIRGTPDAVRLRLNGLGLKNKLAFLNREDVSTTAFTGETEPSYGYESGDITIDPNEQGCLKVDAWRSVKKRMRHHGRVSTRMVKVWSATTTYHTIDTTAC